ncbi:hypothetical protein [Spirosoma pollinicola]|uniref:Uncharacterized protein n=1 Tax=Spirosoma pollinicola TaxID=2057025 RepID=A0A2K8Z8C7_9BACT|nr:hypothetical protein [Spirosoma pollinicola]AUD06121.1 hypothetical protein CWM47_32320 [Spirosoma pollinicola]
MSKLKPVDQNGNEFHQIGFNAYWEKVGDFIQIHSCRMTGTTTDNKQKIKDLADKNPKEIPPINLQNDEILNLYLKDIELYENGSKEITVSGQCVYFVYHKKDTDGGINDQTKLGILPSVPFFYKKAGSQEFSYNFFSNLTNIVFDEGPFANSSSPSSSHNTFHQKIRIFPSQK